MIYLDNNATTKPYPDVVDVMGQFMASRYWNASSGYGHLDGLEEVVESAKASIRNLIGATYDDEVIFTSGATESNNWAVAEGARRCVNNGYILTSQLEHPSIKEAFDNLQRQGVDVRWVNVTKEGLIDLEELATLIDPDIRFASLIYAHNETGVIQPIREAANLIRSLAPQCLIHSDATQAIGKMPISFTDELNQIDLISFSAHKFHGPKGIGGLVIRNGTNIEPFIRGGGQQSNLRSGTLNIPAIAGVNVAARKSLELIEGNQFQSIQTLRNYFESRIAETFPDSIFVGSQSQRLANTSFFGIPGADADDVVYALAAEGIALSKGSSCSAQSIMPPLIALLMEYNHEEATSLLRVSLSYENSCIEVDELIQKLVELLH